MMQTSQKPPQRRASDPAASVWVSANAGSGKTYVLIDRVIRLMLAGTEPSRILCLTFTKAAAAEMNRRLFDRLGEWIAFDDARLDEELIKLGLEDIPSETRDRARKLFTLALETPGGLKIQTLHAFSERLLQLFPVEAGVIPGFEIMDERTAAEMLMAARHAVITQAERDEDSEVGEALQIVAGLVHSDKFDKLVNDILAKRAELTPLLADRQMIAYAISTLRDTFGLEEDDDRDSLVRELTDVDPLLYRDLIEILETRSDTPRNHKSAAALREILKGGAAAESLLCDLFLTDCKCAKPSTFMTDKLRDAELEAAQRFNTEQQRVFEQVRQDNRSRNDRGDG